MHESRDAGADRNRHQGHAVVSAVGAITAVAAFRLPLLGTVAVGVISVVLLRNVL
jgi:uncharacterized membrane protein